MNLPVRFGRVSFSALAIAVLQLQHYVHGFPTGAPTSQCVAMMPSHNVAAQTGTPPFTVTASSTILAPGTSITVTIGGGTFKGFLLEARDKEKQKIVGTFSNSPANTKFIQCTAANDAFTHSDRSAKSNIAVTWTPPNNINDLKEVEFVATVVPQFNTIWQGVKSATLKKQAPTTSAPTTQAPAPTSAGGAGNMSTSTVAEATMPTGVTVDESKFNSTNATATAVVSSYPHPLVLLSLIGAASLLPHIVA